MIETIKVLANTVNLSTATNVYKATAVRISNNGTARTIVIANTAEDTGSRQHGIYPGGQVSFRLNGDETIIVNKKPMDTVSTSTGTQVYAEKVAGGGA